MSTAMPNDPPTTPATQGSVPPTLQGARPAGATQSPSSPPGTTQSTSSPGATQKAEATAGAAKEELGSIATTAKEQASATASAAGEQAAAVVQDARDQAKRVLDETRDQLTSQAADQASKLAASAREVSEQLQGVLRGGAAPSGLVADLAGQAQHFTERMATELEQRSPQDLVDDVRSFARRRPTTFLLAAVGAGLVAGRLVKAVDTQRLTEAAKDGLSSDEGAAGPDNVPSVGSTSDVPSIGSPATAPSIDLTSGTTPSPRSTEVGADLARAVRP